MMTKAMVVVAAALAIGGCTHDGAGAKSPRATSPAIGELLAAVPGNATALGFVDLTDTPWSMIVDGPLMPLDQATREALDQELRAYLNRYLGMDLSKLQFAVGFVSGPPLHGAVVLKTVEGTPKLPGGLDYQGGKLWVVDPDDHVTLAVRAGVVVFGDDTAVRDVLDTQAGKRKAVTEDNKALVDWLREQSRGAVFAFAAVKPAGLPLPPPFSGLQRVAAQVGAHGVAAVLDGDDAAISMIQGEVDRAFAKVLGEIEKQHAAARAGTIKPLEGVMAIIGAAYAKSYAAQIKPRRTGNRLSASLELGTADAAPAYALAMVGILSAVAIPAFMDYTKKVKKPEAALQLNKIGKNAKRVYVETGAFPTSSASLTPPQTCCGQPTNRCAATPALFAANPAWAALDFEIDEPSLFQYSYTGSADGQHFVATATGDLDCDGVPITYELTGSVTDGNPTMSLREPARDSD